MKFVIYRDAQDLFRWRLYSDMGDPMAAGVDGYESKADCLEIIRQLQQACVDAAIEDRAVAST